MVYKSKDGDIELDALVRVYMAGVVEVDGDEAFMSLEWIDMNIDKVELKDYVFVFDFTKPNEKHKNQKVLHFQTKDELFEVMQEVVELLQK